MSETVELSTLNLRYEGYRIRDSVGEARLESSITQRGIEEPLEGVDTPNSRFLLNGFKRYRCARKCGIDHVPYVSLGKEEAACIINLVRTSSDKALGILEQAKFVVDLMDVHQMSVVDVAESLRRSKTWISMRRNLLDETSQGIQDILFRGSFPVYCYMYTLRTFMRMNSIPQEEIEQFMKIVEGKQMSVREIEILANAYFRGPESLRAAIDGGKLDWSLRQVKAVQEDPEGCSDFERALLKDLQVLQKYMRRVTTKCISPDLKSRAFYAQANLLTTGLLSNFEPFCERMKQFHDRSGKA
jgi:hypothetical protein